MKTLFNAFKMWLLRKLLCDLCDKHTNCRDCASYMSWNPTSRPLCAQVCVCEQAIQKWGKKEN